MSPKSCIQICCFWSSLSQANFCWYTHGHSFFQVLSGSLKRAILACLYSKMETSTSSLLVAMATPYVRPALFSLRPVYDRPRCFLLWCLHQHGMRFVSNESPQQPLKWSACSGGERCWGIWACSLQLCIEWQF